MKSLSRELKYCIIGAGVSGLAVAKNFRQQGIPFDCIERDDDIGGVWNEANKSGRVYKTTHMVSSKEFTWFEDFPMPEDFPLFPGHALAVDYLRHYANHFGIMDSIEFGKSVDSVERRDDGWDVTISGESAPRHYSGVIMASGHHDIPRMPDIPGRFYGEVLHSAEYNGPEQLKDKRVLVVGAGNSGGDIAVDAAHHATSVIHSMRRGYYFVPRFMFGLPVDDVIDFTEKMRLPRWLRQRLYAMGHWLAVGPNERFGMQKPKHQILDTHPTVNSEIPALIAEGRMTVRPNIAAFDGSKVRFSDGSEDEVDLVVYATGYELNFPFIERDAIMAEDGRTKLALNMFHPEWDDFFAVGLVNANGSMWRVADSQAQLISGYILARQFKPEHAQRLRDWLAAHGKRMGDKRFLSTERHALEADYYEYMRLLKRAIRKVGAKITKKVKVDDMVPWPERETGDKAAAAEKVRAA